MLTDEDLQKLKEMLATKEDLSKLVTLEEFDRFREEIKQDFAGLRESVDRLAKAVTDLRQEYVAVTAKVDRHEKWLSRLLISLG